MRDIVVTQAKTGEIEGAKGTATAIADLMEDRPNRMPGMMGVRGMGMFEDEPGVDIRAEALPGIARAQAEAGDFEGAKDTAASIDKPEIKADVLAEIAQEAEAAGDK